MTKTYNSGYSLVVTHLTTNPPVRCLNRAERTGSLVFNVLWSYVKDVRQKAEYIGNIKAYKCECGRTHQHPIKINLLGICPFVTAGSRQLPTELLQRHLKRHYAILKNCLLETLVIEAHV